MEEILKNSREKMQKSFEVIQQDFGTVRTGKASVALVENVVVPAYGGTAPMKLMEVATLNAPDAKTITISPFDKSIMSDIEKGLMEASLGMNPIVDGDIIRLSIPPLTEERRKEFSKLIHQKAENGKVMIRQIRHEAMEEVKKKGEENFSEDDVKRIEKEVQNATDEYIKKIDDLTQAKEKEIMTI